MSEITEPMPHQAAQVKAGETVTDFATSAGSPHRGNFLHRLALWAGQTGLGRKLVIWLICFSIVAGIFSFLILSEVIWPDAPPEVIWWILVLDMILVLGLGAVVTWGVVRLWARRRTGAAGSQLHVRLVTLFAVLTVAPAIIVAGLAASFFNTEMRSWFNDGVQASVDNSLRVAQAYLVEHRRVIERDALNTKFDFERQWRRIAYDASLIEYALKTESLTRHFDSAMIFDTNGRVVARTGITGTFVNMLSVIPERALEVANDDRVALLPGENTAQVRALVRLRTTPTVYLYISRRIDANVLAHMNSTQEAALLYQQLQDRRIGIETTLVGLFMLISVLLLLAAVGIGLAFANRLAMPLGRLVEAAEEVRRGNLDVRLGSDVSDGEFSILTRAFNRMTRQLGEQRGELVEANRQLDERRRFTETVLSGVSAGVIGLDAEGHINLPNRSASLLLSTDAKAMDGVPLAELVPEIADLLARAYRDPQRLVEGQVEIGRQHGARTLLVRIAADQTEEGEIEGFVVTFDDMSDLLQAQRTAAWADVARRIAHEIKNPLTPIQLSAERLKRKYLSQISDDPETFTQCTDTIVRQVGDIGRMVDEFSSFARMPSPEMAPANATNICRDAVFLQRNAHPEINISLNLPATKLDLVCDTRQISQAVTNLLQNAVDAINGHDEKNAKKAGSGEITLSLISESGRVEILVEDNGPGLPTNVRDRLTEPYVTTRAEGTGLGLAIVKKIMEDHGGELRLSDRHDGLSGARAQLVFDAQSLAVPEETDLDVAKKNKELKTSTKLKVVTHGA